MILESTPRHEVNQAYPCPICQGKTSCSMGEDRLIMCRRRTGPQPGARYLGQAKKQPEWGLYRLEGDPRLFAGDGVQRSKEAPSGRKENGANGKGKIDWLAAAKQHAELLTEERRARLAIMLGLPISCTYAIPLLGYREDTRLGGCWTFPEFNADGEVLGLVRRLKDNRKSVMAKGSRGLTITAGWEESVGPLFLPEGASDCLALAALGLAAIGRASADQDVQQLADLLRDQPAGRDLIVLGEWDMKADGKWPGLAGAVKAAEGLAAALGRPVSWSLPPDRAKDVRAWASALGGANESPELWPLRGQKFETGLQLQKVEPVKTEAAAEGLVITTADQIQRDVIRYLVPGYLPQGKLVAMAGDGGEGKSFVTCHLMACLTTGRCAFGLAYDPLPPCEVLAANCEDDRADTQIPRLEAAGADLSKVRLIDGVRDKEGKLLPFSFLHLQQIRAQLQQRPQIRLVVIDPASAYVAAAGVNDNSDAEVRSLLGPLSEMAEESRALILLIKHFNKSTGGKASHKMAGAVSYRNASRVCYYVFPKPREDPVKCFLCDKINNGPMPVGLEYKLVMPDPATIDHVMQTFPPHFTADDKRKYVNSMATVQWLGESTWDTKSICQEEEAAEPENWNELDKAALWLKKFLRSEPRTGQDCVAIGNEDLEITRDERWWRDKVLSKRLNGKPMRATGAKHSSWYWCLQGQVPPHLRIADQPQESQGAQESQEAQESGGGCFLMRR